MSGEELLFPALELLRYITDWLSLIDLFWNKILIIFAAACCVLASLVIEKQS